MSELDRSGYREFDRILDLARRTREVIEAAVIDGALPDGAGDLLADETLPHVESIQAGFRGWLRTEGIGLAELQYLLLQLGTMRTDPAVTPADRDAAAAEMIAELRMGGHRPRPILEAAEPWHLAALAHARLVLATLPKLADADVRWPAGRSTYADIPIPRGPAELAERLTELEQQLWRLATGRLTPRTDPALRRTYGFFDAAERLGERGFGLVA
jgi:hypothetical protein